MSDQPFDGEGKTIGDILDSALKFWNKSSVQHAIESSEEIITLILATKAKSPLSMGKIGLHVTKEVLEFYDSTRMKDAQSPVWEEWNRLIDKDYIDVIPSYLSVLFLPFLDKSKIEVVAFEEKSSSNPEPHVLYRYQLPSGTKIFWADDDNKSTNIICAPSFESKEVLDEIVGFAWRSFDNHIEINIHDATGEFEFHEKSVLPWRYEGNQGPRLIERWKKFYSQDIRRSVILHGPPGTGKSTLAQQAAREIEGRVLFVPVQVLQALNNQRYFISAVEVLSPEILIIDDIDRLNKPSLDMLLSFFEETETKVPLRIATTNHIQKLPNAIKRPGRFDEIWKIQAPDDEIRIRVIRYLAELEGVELSEDQAEMLSDIGSKKNLPGAHIREVIRRISVLGWEDAINFTGDDLTFSSEWVKKDEYDSMPPNPMDDEFDGEVYEDEEGYMELTEYDYDELDYYSYEEGSDLLKDECDKELRPRNNKEVGNVKYLKSLVEDFKKERD